MFKIIRSDWFNQFKGILSSNDIDRRLWDELEELLIISDIGLHSTEMILDNFKTVLRSNKSNASLEDVIGLLKNELVDLLHYHGGNQEIPSHHDSVVLMMIGVNGVGKTTSIAKLAHFYKTRGNSVMLGASDTFRAAAIDQLELWARKIKVDIIKSETGSDPASVAFKTAEFTKKNRIDIALIDTAGRLQNKKNLMEEYKKIINVLKKIDNDYPNEIILVLDATTGQNALNQVEEFSKIHNLTGLIITKLDSTAKGGIVLAICKKYKLPIIAVGMGEKEDDLQPFKADLFAKTLLSIN